MGFFDNLFGKKEKDSTNTESTNIIKVEKKQSSAFDGNGINVTINTDKKVTPNVTVTTDKNVTPTITITPDLSKSSSEMTFEDYVTPEAYLDFQYLDDVNMYENIKEYKEQIDYAAQKWGVSPNIVAAIIAQESSGELVNLMQIDFGVNKDGIIKVYNFNDNRYDKFVLTDNPSKYSNQGITCISREDLNNPKTNISIGTAMLASHAKDLNYHIPSAIQSFNFGVDRTNRALALAGNTDEIKNDQTNLSFMNYTDQVNIILDKDGNEKRVGDSEYLKNVMRYIHVYDESRGNDTITFKHMDGDVVKETSVQILPKTS